MTATCPCYSLAFSVSVYLVLVVVHDTEKPLALI